MGGFFETERMKKHVEQCAVCQAAHAGADIKYAECCDEYGEMFNNVIDFECGEGPFEEDGTLMCDDCDGPLKEGRCPACKKSWCVADIHACSSSDCDEYEPCGKPAVGETDNGYGHGSFP